MARAKLRETVVKVTSEHTDDSQVILSVEVEPERLEKSRDQAYRRIAGRVNIPGFRRGKAPRYLVERYVGPESLMEEALKSLIPDTYREALAETKVEPIDQPDIELVQTEPLIYKATVAVEPTVTLGDYASVRMKPEEVKVEPQDVDRLIEGLRHEHAEWREPEEPRPVREGDRVTIDVQGHVDGKPLLGPGPHEGLEITVREGSFLPGFHEVLVGMNVGETKAFTLPLPQAVGEEEVSEPPAEPATPEAVGEVTLRGIKEEHLPALDDEFAKSVGAFATMAEVRARLEESLRSQLEAGARERLENAVIGAAVERSQVEPPPAMINREVEHSMENLQSRLESQGLNLAQFLRHLNQTEEAYRESLKPQARERVRTRLVLREIARAEGITVTPEEVDQEVEKLRTMLGDQDADLRNRLGQQSARHSIEANLLERKTIDRLVQYALSEEPEAAPVEGAAPADEEAEKAEGSEGA